MPAARVFTIVICTLLSIFSVACGQGSASRVSLETLSPAALSGATDNGALPTSERLNLTLTLAPSPARAAALRQFLTAVITPGSSSYHQWLTPAQFSSSFGASSDQIASATAWAQSAGLTVESVSPSGTRLTISGFTLQIQSAFGVTLHSFRLNDTAFYANLQQPSLPASAAVLFTGIDGLDSLPANSTLTLAGAPASFAALSQSVDANDTPLLPLSSGLCMASVSASQIAEFQQLSQQAAAQGITILSTSTCSAGGFPSGLADVTSITTPGGVPETATPLVERPAWQSAPGLPADALRHSPDLTVTSAAALASTLSTIASSMPQQRLGNINPILYELAPTPGLYTQPGDALAGTWEAATGLGLVSLEALAKSYPRGTGTSFTSFASSNYSPTHGQSVTMTSSVTSGTGGATPTGTVSFITSTGTTLGTSSLVAGTASFATNALNGGTYTVQAKYSGDGTYAASSSTTSSFYVQPEPAQLSAVVSPNNIVGGSFTATVTETSASGVGVPTGTASVMISGIGQSGSQVFLPSGTGSAVATVTLAANNVGNLTLSINCTTDQNFSCYNPLTTGVTISKATPALTFSYSPTPAVAGSTIMLNASLTAAGTAPIPTGNVEFFDGTTVLNAGALKNGTVTVTGIVPNTSTHSISATYDGDANYLTVTSNGSAPVTTTSSTATLTATILPATAVAGATATVNATVTLPGTSAPSGTVVANITLTGTTSTNTGTLVPGAANSSTVAIPITVPPAGTYQVVVSCPSNASYTCNSVSLPLASTATTTTKIATTTLLTIAPIAPVAGSSVTLTATVSSATSGSAAISGTVNFYSGTTLLGTGTIASGVATTTVTFTTTSLQTLTAVYSGDTNYTASTSPAVTTGTATTTLAPTVVTLTSSAAQAVAGGSLTLTAQVDGTITSGASPTGTVSFYVSGTTPRLLGTSALSASGTGLAVATLYTSQIPAGTQTLYAVYVGDTNFASSTSATITLGLTDYSVTFTPATLTLASGQTGQVALLISSAGAFTGNVAMNCVPPANAGITCSISPASLTGTGSATLTINTVAPELQTAEHASLRPVALTGAAGASLAAMLCLLLPSRGRRRLSSLFLLVLAAGLTMNLGCSQASVAVASAPSGGTPQGTVMLTINTSALSGSTGVTHDYTYQVTIQ